jgi:hypothetical protein
MGGVCGLEDLSDKLKEDQRCQRDHCSSYQTFQSASSLVNFESLNNDPIYEQIKARFGMIQNLLYPYVVSGKELPNDVEQQIQVLLDEAIELSGGNLEDYVLDHLVELEDDVTRKLGNAPSYSVLYMAVVQREGQTVFLRGKTGVYGQYELFVPRDGTLLYVSFFDPMTNSYGISYPYLSPNTRYRLPRFYLHSVTQNFPDSDKDNLADVVELIYGTDLGRIDTDHDGISDGAEVVQGTDPLGGFIAQTGIIGSADTPGTAVDICVQNDLAVVADSNAGVAIFNIFDSMNPKLVAQVDTPGNARAVACRGNHVAVADDNQGLAIIDITNLSSAKIIHQVNVGANRAQEVAVVGNRAYVAAGNEVILVDLLTGNILDQQQYSGGVLNDLAVAGDYLYLLLVEGISPQTVHKVWLGDTLELPVASLTIGGHPTFGRTHIFAGGDRVYVGAIDDNFSNQTPGIGIIRDAQGKLEMIGPPSAITAFDVEANGSGLALFTGADPSLTSNARFAVLDVKDPTQTDNFITAFDTPGSATAIALYQGRAYVADGGTGMQVINYLAYDSQKQPPTITLSTNFAPDIAEEGALMRVTANATDDVQVRLVEFYVDGKLVATDGSFPFDVRITTPRLADQLSFTLRARAIDTGGNESWTAEQTITLTQDATPPRVVGVTPGSGALGDAGGTNTIAVTFNEAMAAASLTNASFKLFTFGPDQLPATTDDVEVTGGTVAVPNPKTATLTFGAGLPADRYRAILTTAVTDAIGNQLAGEFGWTFQLVPVIQIGDVVNDAISVPRELDIYHFTATPGQQVFFDVLNHTGPYFDGWRLTDSAGMEIFDRCFGCTEAGVRTLSLGGVYTLTVGSTTDAGTGSYSLKLWNVPAPHVFTINVGDTISNGVPGPGAGNIESPGVQDIYHFTATPGQQVFFDLLSHTGPYFDGWRLTDSAGTEIFDRCFGCTEVGIRTLTRGGVYTITVGSDTDDGTGTYAFKLWPVPSAQQFNINIGDTVSNGVPSAGAGNIESPGSKDVYQFTATAGQRVLINLQSVAPQLTQVTWQLVDATGAVLFNTCLGCSNPGSKTLTRGGVYTLTVGDDQDNGVGTYQFQVIAQ